MPAPPRVLLLAALYLMGSAAVDLKGSWRAAWSKEAQGATEDIAELSVKADAANTRLLKAITVQSSTPGVSVNTKEVSAGTKNEDTVSRRRHQVKGSWDWSKCISEGGDLKCGQVIYILD